jgi:hypothetical protein
MTSPPKDVEAVTIDASKKSFNGQYPSEAPIIEIISHKSFNGQFPSVHTLSNHMHDSMVKSY